MARTTGRSEKFRGMWKKIVGYETFYGRKIAGTHTFEIKDDENGLPFVDFTPIPRDPSLRDQLHERATLDAGTVAQSYLDACAKAPNASASTKRKWRKALGLG